LCLLITLVYSAKKCGSKCHKKKYKKIKKSAKKFKHLLKDERRRSEILLLEINKCKNNHDSSFLEMRSDPVFKTMTFGFPIPRSTSYTGIAGAANNNKFKKLQMCPAGCIVGGD